MKNFTMKKSRQNLILMGMVAIVFALLTRVAIFINESPFFTNGYETFHITGTVPTISALLIIGVSVYAGVKLVTGTKKITDKFVTN